MKDIIKVFAVSFGIGAFAGAGVGMVEDIRDRAKAKRLRKAWNKITNDLNGFAEKLDKKET